MLRSHLKRLLDAVLHPTVRLEANTDFPLTGKTLGVAYAVGFVLFMVGSILPVGLFMLLILAMAYMPPSEYVASLLNLFFEHSGQPRPYLLAALMAVSFLGGFAAQMTYLSRLLRKRGYKLTDVVGLSTRSLRGSNWAITFWSIFWRAFVLFAGVLCLENVLTMFVHVPEQPTVEFARMLSGGSIWIFVVIAAIGAPLLEEFVFRGILFQALRATFHGYVAAANDPAKSKLQRWLGRVIFTNKRRAELGSVMLSAAVFALWHLQFHPLQLMLLFVMGCALAEAFRRSGTLWTSIALHALNNGLAALLLVLASK